MLDFIRDPTPSVVIQASLAYKVIAFNIPPLPHGSVLTSIILITVLRLSMDPTV